MADKKLDKTAIDNERAALLVLMDEMSKTNDDDMREELADVIKAQAQKLLEMCDDLQAAADEIVKNQPQEEPNAVVEVVLTPEQRAHVLAETGIDVPSVRIPDPTSELTRNMAFIQPDFIEERAIIQANQYKAIIEGMESGDSSSDVTG